MNTLAYALLSFLARRPMSGYDLMLAIQPLWQAKHSQIYPLLAKLETEGHVDYVLVEQKDKPDKKVYSITESGHVALQDWLQQPSGDPIIRDEMVLKLYTLWLGDHASAKRVVEERIAYFRKRLQRLEVTLADVQDEHSEVLTEPDILSPVFTRLKLLERAITTARLELDWCFDFLKQIEQSEKKPR
ncbi:PadR family transcriptional regulator [Tumebacillus sp. ITR2]|uniref:PadR family transcriptional regulator n=1 Tax=Tumebacillus amylolyticus TaxID=2801339 RepID=A0ABS1J4N1_9BACL|nr:PadR family transcriptional regulator [Tumebacillus amylolyticus]MBL0385232.1 PadR family transcriptional regulator [Tumebacillus amylolyticus]